MITEDGTRQLIGTLTAALQPVKPLRAPVLRAFAWLLTVSVIAGILILCFANLSVFWERISVMRVAIECVATGLTAITATIAAFEVSLPDRSARWAWLPLPSFVVWLSASGLGCLRNGLFLRNGAGFLGESRHCFVFIAAVSVPLAAGLFWMLRRAHPIAPLRVAALGALGTAATAAFLLQFFHPFDVTVIDLSVHLAAIGAVLVAAIALRGPLLSAS